MIIAYIDQTFAVGSTFLLFGALAPQFIYTYISTSSATIILMKFIHEFLCMRIAKKKRVKGGEENDENMRKIEY